MDDLGILGLLFCFLVLFVGSTAIMQFVSKKYVRGDPFHNSNIVSGGGVVLALLFSVYATGFLKYQVLGGRQAHSLAKAYAPLVAALFEERFEERDALLSPEDLRNAPFPAGEGVLTVYNSWGEEGWAVEADRMVRMPNDCRGTPGTLPAILILIHSTRVHIGTWVGAKGGREYSYTYDFQVVDVMSEVILARRSAEQTSIGIPSSLYEEVESLACCLASSKRSKDPGSWNKCWEGFSVLSNDR